VPVAKKTAPATLEIPALQIRIVIIGLRGTSELITHAWSEKAKKEMRDKQMGKARLKKEPKDPLAEYEAAFYRLPDGRPAMRAIGLKMAAVQAASQIGGLTKVFLRGAFHIPGELVEIEGEPRMREDMVRVGMGTADLRYRPGFPRWYAYVPVRYNANVITLEQLTHLFSQAGFSVGLAEWRVEKNGDKGMFEIDSVEEAPDFDLEAYTIAHLDPRASNVFDPATLYEGAGQVEITDDDAPTTPSAIQA
jgi:hypothetical protein